MSTDHITIADDSYECHAPDDSWRFGLYLDPSTQTVSHWEHYGDGTPMPVWLGQASLIPLPLGAVGAEVKAILEGDTFRDLAARLFGLWEGTEWDGSNWVGRWRSQSKYDSEADSIEREMTELFAHVAVHKGTPAEGESNE